MAGSNTTIVRNAFKEFKKTIEAECLSNIELYAQNIVIKAVEFRMKEPGAHNFTGNLLNSIVAAVYYNKEFKKAFFSSETGIKQPRYYEMTASHNGTGRYHFKIDYSGQESNYTATVDTYRRKGMDDAIEFLSVYQPDMNGYLVVVAYTVDYANFVEIERSTTGYLNTMKYAQKAGMRFFQLPSKAS